MALLSESGDAINKPTAFECCLCFINVFFGDLISILRDSDITSLHQQVEALASVTGVFCTECCTLGDYTTRNHTIVERDLNSLSKNIAEFASIVRRKLEFLLTEAGLDFRAERFSKLEIVRDADDSYLGRFQITVCAGSRNLIQYRIVLDVIDFIEDDDNRATEFV